MTTRRIAKDKANAPGFSPGFSHLDVQGLEWADGQTSFLISDATGWRNLKVLPYMGYGTLGCHIDKSETPGAH